MVTGGDNSNAGQDVWESGREDEVEVRSLMGSMEADEADRQAGERKNIGQAGDLDKWAMEDEAIRRAGQGEAGQH